jgi:hypothetical protein
MTAAIEVITSKEKRRYWTRAEKMQAITQPPAPFYAMPRGYIGPQLLATIVFDKVWNARSAEPAEQSLQCEGLDLSVSTLADQVGATSFALMPLYRLIEADVLAAERLHGDETTVPILAKGKKVTGRIWTYVRDDRPFGSRASPASVYYGRARPPRRTSSAAFAVLHRHPASRRA